MKKKKRNGTRRRRQDKKNQNTSSNRSALKLSACMIVKDEEDMLPRCLASIKDHVDEIVIVDTGSTDRSVEIAESFGARVFHHPWENNFSLHRNQSISYARGEWVFIIDADEELLAEDVPIMRKAVQDETVDAIMVQVVNRLRKSPSVGMHSSSRVLRNNGVIHYEGRIHNRVVGVTKARVFPIRVFHYGYDLEKGDKRKKFERTVALLKKDLDEDPQNPITWHYLSCSYLSEGMMNEALECSLRAIELSRAKNDRDLVFLWSRYNAAISLYRQKKYDQAEQIALGALKEYPRHIDSHFILLLIAYERSEWTKVLEHGSQYLDLVLRLNSNPVEFDNLVTCSVNETWNMHVLIAIAQFELGRITLFEDSIERAVECAPEPYVALRAAGIYLHNKGDLEKARPYLERVLVEMPGEDTAQRLLKELPEFITAGNREPTISCCMIVKNEEAFLEQCLTSVKDYVDEIVIVDTGSRDGTVEIAERYTDKLYFHPWEGDFSKARNQASSYASGDWIFIIDGDEELVQGSGERLREAVRSAGEADAFLVNTISTYSKGARRARHNSERLFRNNGVIRYEGIVHNRVVGARAIKASQIEVMHYGYDVDEKKANEKFLRTTGLLKRQVAEQPDNPMPHHYLGVSYLSRGMNQEAVEESVLAVELAEKNNDEHPLYIWARHNAAMAFFRLGDFDKAREYSLNALGKYPDHLDSCYTLAMVAGERAEWKDALTYGEKHLKLLDIFEKSPEKAGLIINGTMNEAPSVHLLIGHAKHAFGGISEMEEEYQTAADLSEDKWLAWWNAGCFHLDRSGDLALAEKYLDAALKEAPDKQEIWYMLAKLHNKKSAVKEEKQCLEKLREMGSKDPVVLDRLVKLYLESGQREAATKILGHLIELDPSNYKALYSLGRLHQDQAEFEEAVSLFQRALESFQEAPEPWLRLGEISLELGRLSEARDFFTRVLSLGAHELSALLCLCEIELKENRLIEFVHACDEILKRLDLDRKRTIEGLYDMVGVLKEIRHAVKDHPELDGRTGRILALLESRLNNFGDGVEQGRGRNPLEHSVLVH